MQRNKNIILLIVFLSLIVWTIIYLNLENGETGISLDEDKFSIKDTTSISIINIIGNSISNTLEKHNTHWIVNGKYPMDPSMHKVLMSVLFQVKVKRTVPKNDLERIKNDIQKNGYVVEIINSDGHKNTFYAGGNGISLSYFMSDENIPYVVHLPGYESYVTGIFEVQENDWRDRLVFQTSWLGIKSLKLTYFEDPGNNVLITAENDLYRISGVEHLDTAELMSFFDEISYFFTDRYINPGQIPSYDSLKSTKPFASMIVYSLGMMEPVTIDFYKQLPGENVMFGVLNNEQMCLFGTRRINEVFKRRKDFIAE
jgi:hypothetical protein